MSLSLVLCFAVVVDTPVLATCIGDCNGNGEVTVDELVTGVSIALGENAPLDCPAFDDDHDGAVTVNELVSAVGNALVGCPKAGTLLRGIQFVPDTIESSGPDLRTRLLLIGSELVFTDGSDFPIKVLSLETGVVRPLVRKMGVPEDLVVTGNAVVWTEAQSGFAPSGCVGQGVIRLVNETTLGPTPTTRPLARKDNCASAVGDLIVHEDMVYWVSSRVSPPEYSIERTRRNGGTGTTVYTTPETIAALARDSQDLFWLEVSMSPGWNGAVKKMPLIGGSPSVIAEGLVTDGSSRRAMAIYAERAILTEPAPPLAYRLVAIPLAGGETLVLAPTPAPARAIVGIGADIYWIDDTGLRSVPLAGGEVITLLDSIQSGVDLAAEGNALIWTESVCCAHDQKGDVRRLELGAEPVTLAADVDAPGAVTVSDGVVYWAEGGPIGLTEGFGRIAAVPLDGGDAIDLAAGVSTTLPAVVSDGRTLHYVDRFRVESVPLQGGIPTSTAAADFYIMGLATDGERVYWTEDPLALVNSAPVTGGSATTLAFGDGPAGPVAVFSDFVYWADGFDRILRVPKIGGTSEAVVTNIQFLSDMVVDGSGIYFSEQDSGGIRRAPLEGGAVTSIASGAVFSWNILALDSQAVYWIEQLNIGRAPKGGGSQAILVTGLDSDVFIANAIVSDGSRIYWTEVGGGTIRMMPVAP